MFSESKSTFTGKIAIATDDYLTVTGHIGRCNGFIIYELAENKIINRIEKENKFTAHKIGEHDHHGEHSHSKLIEALSGCSYLICTSAGWRVIEELKGFKIEVIFSDESDAGTAVKKFVEGNLVINEDGTCRNH